MVVQSVASNAVADAVLTVLKADLDTMVGTFTAHHWGDATPNRDYVLVAASRRFGGTERLGGLASTAWRVTVRAVGEPWNVRVLLDRCTRVLEESPIVVGDLTSSPAVFETEDAVRQDDDDRSLYSGLRSFTLVL